MRNGDLVAWKKAPEKPIYIIEDIDDDGSCVLRILEDNQGYARGRYTKKNIEKFGTIIHKNIVWRKELC